MLSPPAPAPPPVAVTEPIELAVPLDPPPAVDPAPPVPAIVNIEDKEASKLFTDTPPVTLIVTVPVPELASNITSSATVGKEAPEAPPDVADQFVVKVLFQVPEPPTQ
jgi:hypothetical protein